MKSGTFLVFPAFTVSCVCGAQQAALVWFGGLEDPSLYLKPRFNTPNSWDQQFGLRAKIVKDGNFSADYLIAYDPLYPIKFDIHPRWTTGVQFAYFFTNMPIPVGV
jgi:hypothetical protein